MKCLHAIGMATGLIAAGLSSSLSAEPSSKPAPMFEGLGSLHHPITTSSKKAQRYFDQGLTLCYAFNHREAIRSFEGAAKSDPECAMAYWGVAYAHGPHVNKPMTQEENDRAWAAIQKAVALKTNVTAREQAYITAMSKRYQAEFKEDRSKLDKAYAAAMRDVVRDYPDDLDAQTMLAEALMDTMPWDYWKERKTPKPETEEVLAALRLVLSRDPDHPGANHLYIHAVEAGPQPELGLPSADRLGRFAPQAGHLVHMPSHIYMRVGQYEEAVVANEKAAKADQYFIRHCKAQGFYPGAYYPHNVHFLWYANLFQGRSQEALAAARKAADIAMENTCGPSKAVEGARFRHLPWLTWARFGQWDEILKVQQPPATNDFLIDRVMWHFARGLAFAAARQPEPAAAEHAALSALVNSPGATNLNSPQFPATGILAVADHWLAGKVARAQGDLRGAVKHLEQAVAAEDALPYMEPAYWPIPVRPVLGAALIEAGEPVKAEQVFREDLKNFPRNGWGLLGLEQSLRLQGRNQPADLVKRQFDEAWKRADVKLDLAWF